MDNAEISNIVKIVGLQYKKKYETMEDLKSLRYGRLMIMTDQDQVKNYFNFNDINTNIYITKLVISCISIKLMHNNKITIINFDFLGRISY